MPGPLAAAGCLETMMLLALLPVLLAPGTHLQAGEGPGPGLQVRTERVTLHSRGALVEAAFEAEAEATGVLSLRLGPFPTTARRDSFRVRILAGDAQVADLAIHEVEGAFLDPARRAQLEAELDSARRERKALDADLAGVASGESLLEALIGSLGRGEQGPGLAAGDSAGLDAMFRFVQERRAQLVRQRLAVEAKGSTLDERVRDLQQQLHGGKDGAHLELAVRVAAGGPGRLRGEVVYLQEDASWQPGYELRVAPDLTGITVALVAQVRQSGGLDWQAAEFLMSTSRPELGLAPPPLPLRVLRTGKRAAQRGLAELGYGGDAAREPEASVEVEDLGLTALFRLPGRRTVLGNGQPHRFVLREVPLEVRAERYVVPSLSARGFLRATVRHTGDAPLLPGAARVFLGPDYLGQTSFPSLRPGDETTLYLGVDPNLSVRRETIQDERDEPGWLGSTVRLTRVYRATLRLSAAAPAPVTILVEEAIPVSRASDVEVTAAQVQPLPLHDEESLRLQAEQGIYRWRLTLAPGQEQNVRWGYVVSFDEAEEPVLMEEPRPAGGP